MNKKHYYIFKVKCDHCGKPFIIKLDLYVFIEPEWLIRSVPIKNICEKCNIRSMFKKMINIIKNSDNYLQELKEE